MMGKLTALPQTHYLPRPILWIKWRDINGGRGKSEKEGSWSFQPPHPFQNRVCVNLVWYFCLIYAFESLRFLAVRFFCCFIRLISVFANLRLSTKDLIEFNVSDVHTHVQHMQTHWRSHVLFGGWTPTFLHHLCDLHRTDEKIFGVGVTRFLPPHLCLWTYRMSPIRGLKKYSTKFSCCRGENTIPTGLSARFGRWIVRHLFLRCQLCTNCSYRLHYSVMPSWRLG